MKRILTRWLPRLLAGLLLLAGVLAGLIYALTDHPKPVQAADLSCPDSAPTLRAGQAVRVMNWNVQYLAGRGYVFFYDTLNGDGPDTRPSPESLARTLDEVTRAIRQEQPDLILLQEIDRDSRRTDYQDQLALLQERLGGAFPCAASTYYHRAAFVPHPSIMGRVGLSLVTLSRYRLDTATRYQLPRICGDPVTVAFNFRRAVLGVTLPVQGGAPLSAFNTHMDAFAQGCDTMQRQAAFVNDLLGAAPTPWVMGGDSTCSAPAPPTTACASGNGRTSTRRRNWPRCSRGSRRSPAPRRSTAATRPSTRTNRTTRPWAAPTAPSTTSCTPRTCAAPTNACGRTGRRSATTTPC